jgi:hypothetical protein
MTSYSQTILTDQIERAALLVRLKPGHMFSEVSFSTAAPIFLFLIMLCKLPK